MVKASHKEKKLHYSLKGVVPYLKTIKSKLKINSNIRFQLALLATIFILPLALTAFLILITKPNYGLSKTALDYTGNVETKLLNKDLTLDKKTATYYLNKQDINQGSNPDAISMGGNVLNSSAYSLSIPTKISKGITIYDNKDKLSFSLTPTFTTASGKYLDNRFVYPLSNQRSTQDVYTVKANGLEEDLILNKAVGQTASYSYNLKLPSSLQARLMPSGAVGIYSANPALFGNISYSSAKDEQLVNKARINSAKTNLVFAIPTPIIQTPNHLATKVVAKYSLNKNLLTINLSNMPTAKTSYPLDIDPSIIVQSASSFGMGNNEGDINVSTSTNQIAESGITGGTVGTWTTNTSTYYTVNEAADVVYNGYIYILGGNGSSGGDGCILTAGCDGVQYAPFCTAASTPSGCPSTNWQGQLGSWNYTYNSAASSSFVGGFNIPREELSAAAYNGYIYVIGGFSADNTADCSAVACNGVQYAPINANGTIGSWNYTYNSAASSSFVGGFTGPRYSAATTVYNGYLYLIGGANESGTAANDCTTAYYTNDYLCNGVQYAPINANGTIGSWNYTYNSAASSSFTSSGLSNPVYNAGAASYNGYIYLAGGTDASGDLNTVQYAPLDANGTVGSWASTTTFGTSRSAEGATVYNGYFYIMGGQNNSGGKQFDVQYAPIFSDGRLGSFNTTTAFNSGDKENGNGAFGYNGYLYMPSAGGLVGGNDVQSVAIQSPGTTSSFSSTNFTNARFGLSSVVYNSYIYVMGGCDSSTTQSCNTFDTTIYKAAIGSAGALGSYTATSVALPVAAYGMAAIAIDGYMYVMGGCTSADAVGDNCTGFSDNTYYVPLVASSGNITSSWTTASNTFTTGRWGASAVVYNNYLYLIGGCSGSSSAESYKLCDNIDSDVQYTEILAPLAYSPSPWANASNPLSTGRFDFGVAQYRNKVYVVGGCEGSATANNACTTIGSDIQVGNLNGSTVTWSTSNVPMSLGAYDNQAVVSNGYLYLVGGCTGQVATPYYGCAQPSSAVFEAPISMTASDASSIGSFTTVTSLSNATYNFAAVAYNGFLYVSGGCEGISNSSNVGCSAELGSTILAQINNGGLGGVDSPWASGTALYTATSNATTVAYNNYIYEIAGNTGSSDTPAVYYTTLSPGGKMGSSWSLTNGLNTAGSSGLDDATSVTYGGYVYVIGGNNSSSGTLSTVYYAAFCTAASTPSGCPSTNWQGQLGTWNTTNSLPTAYQLGNSAAYNGYLYELNGYNSSLLADNPNVYYAAFCTAASTPSGCPSTNWQGQIGSWNTTTSTSLAAVEEASSVSYNGYLYSIGGLTSSGFSLTGVLYAPFCTAASTPSGCPSTNWQGQLGTWNTTTNLPYYANNGFAVALNGFVYEIEGVDSSASVVFAPINSDGSVGNWQSTVNPAFGGNQQYGSGTEYNGYIYDLGGDATAITTKTFYAGLQSIPRIGYYSQVVDNGQNTTPLSLLVQGSDASNYGAGGVWNPGQGGIGINYSFADSTCSTLNTQTDLNYGDYSQLNTVLPLSFTTDGCSNTAQSGRYLYLRYALDDSQLASFPDANANHTTITSYTYYFHPATGSRLRLGQTFVNNQLNSLDAPPGIGN